MRNFRSEHAYQKHKPKLSLKEKILRSFRKKKYTISSSQDSFHYKANPFRETKKVSKTKIKAIVLAALLLAWIISLAYTPYFRINKISYSGLQNTTESELDDFIHGNYLNKKSFLPINDYFLVNATKISDDLYKKFPFETVEVIKVFPNQLNINVKEKLASIIYDNGKKYFLLDSNGTVTKYLKDVELYERTLRIASNTLYFLISDSNTSTILATSTIEHTPDYKKINSLFGNYPIVYDQRGLDVEEKQENVLPYQHITAIIDWFKTLNEQGIAGVKYFTLDNLYSGVIINTTKPWRIIFQPTSNTQTQIKTLKELLPTLKQQQYIDLRFGEKVYLK